MMSDVYDFPADFPTEFPARKRATTYGKSAKKRVAPTSNGTLRNRDSTTEISAPSAPSTSSYSSPEPQPKARPGVSALGGRRRLGGRNARPANPRSPDEAQSQPLPEGSATNLQQDEDVKIKKRRLTRTYSERKENNSDPYAMPDSPPRPVARQPAMNVEKERPRPAPRVKAAPKSQVTPEKDISMKDVVAPFSEKTSRSLDKLGVGAESPRKSNHHIPLRLSREQEPPPSRPITKKRPEPPRANIGDHPAGKPAPRKKRLIDALAEQADGSSEEEEEEDAAPPLLQRPKPPKPEPVTVIFQSSSPPPPAALQGSSRNMGRPVAVAKKAGPKFTYNQQRSMLAEEDTLLGSGRLPGIDEEPSNGSLFSFARLPKVSTINTFSFLDEDDETVNTGAVRSIHELRQAGANSRFADEMDDIMDRIGSPSAKPSSLRRGALLELAQKMSEKAFRQQFRNHSGDGSLFKSLGEETDLVSGYSILAILVTLLAASSSAHLLQQLRMQGFAALLGRLLGEGTDIVPLAKDKKQNVTRNGQTTLGTVKSSILKSPIWEPTVPTSLSPRTLALKCLDLIMRQPSHSPGESEIFSPAVTDRLFSTLSTSASSEGEACWDLPSHQESTDFYLALYVLESQSISAMQSNQGSRWTRRYVPVVVNILEKALRRPIDKFNDLESLTLRITLNTTNNNPEAVRMFVDNSLLQELAGSACRAFETVLNSMKVDAFLSKVHESLIMMLGVMINFCVYYPPASQSLEEVGDSTASALDRLIRIFADNHSKTSDADSMEKTQLNVALGYLSILLGYLCLCESIRERFILVHPKKSIQPLLDSINEFIAFHHKVAEAQGGEGGAKQETNLTALVRLQGLVSQLKA
ncbi:wings apart-like protein regulation of heterochromatin-domain-containing protein [Lasiosphaeria hispida]|uniref:Wings apart-like protein regulation of heterochromatin-domain-containing protein n=1 Tax=Lasiosphaeria hispida TaxID=260671 RepID=A0AAJ0HPW0_9PEZI|nr:wings apart-like protein regulation of heterochromatin-domain-containing protein [Lasiosphaeria hispida]